MSLGLLICSLFLSNGCFTRHIVGQDAIAAMRTGGRDQAIVVGGSRLSPVERVRVGDGNGRFGPRLTGSQIYVGTHGLYARNRFRRTFVIGARVTGLSPQQADALRAQAPFPEALAGDMASGFELRVGGLELASWFERFRDTEPGVVCANRDVCGRWLLVLDLRLVHAIDSAKPVSVDSPAGEELPGEDLTGEVLTGEELTDEAMAGEDMPSGEVTAEAIPADAVDSKSMTSIAAFRAMRTGSPMWIGWSWDELEQVEIEHLSGPRTMGAVFGVPVAIAGMFAGGLHILGRVIKNAEDREPWMPLSPSLIGEPTEDVRPLFSSRLRRRSVALYLLNVQSDVEVGVSGVGAQQTLGLTAGVRLRELVDFEVGFRASTYRDYVRQHVALPDPDDDTGDGPPDGWPRTDLRGYAAVFRFGFHFPLDAQHRYAIPVGIEVGGGPGSRYFQSNFGLRLGLGARSYVGIYPFNPTRVNFGDDADPGDKTYWSFQSGVEIGVSL